MHWEITPHHDPSYCFCVMPGGTVEDDQAALKYAIERLADAFDQLNEIGETAIVTIKLATGDAPED